MFIMVVCDNGDDAPEENRFVKSQKIISFFSSIKQRCLSVLSLSKKKILHKLPLTHRTSSGSEYMLGKIAQLEVGKLSVVSELVLSGKEFAESSTNNLHGPHSTYSLDEVIMTPATPLATHNTTTRGEKNNDGGDSINDNDDSSVSFSDKFR